MKGATPPEELLSAVVKDPVPGALRYMLLTKVRLGEGPRHQRLGGPGETTDPLGWGSLLCCGNTWRVFGLTFLDTNRGSPGLGTVCVGLFCVRIGWSRIGQLD